MTSPNVQQQKLIDSTDGIYLVDAGAGTGKTFTITRRYANILETKDVEPDDILLVTFTNNAADQMKERIVNQTNYPASKLFDAPISTFHSLCKKMVEANGIDVPKYIGVDDSITPNTRLMESQVRERQEFDRFIKRFIDNHPEYSEYYRVTRDYSDLLDLVKSLASKGIIPTRDGWYKNTEDYLDGDYNEFKRLFKQANKPRKTSNGSKQSDLRSRLYSMQFKTFPEDAPSVDEVRGGYGTKQIRMDFCKKSFKENREALKDFVHDLYYGYIEYCLSRNYINFNLLLTFSYVLLMEDPDLRKRQSYEYVMVDEFQDTNEIQFKLMMLFAAEDNICVVGDWKQSIYSFQYATVENIQRFRNRLEEYRAELNREEERIPYSIDSVEPIKLVENYRSTQDILDFSEQSLLLKANDYEKLDEGEIEQKITSLNSNKDGDSVIKALTSDDEVEAVLTKIQEVVGNEEYIIDDDGERAPAYEDIAVLTRTRSFGLELQEKAREYGIPVAYEGGVELFKTNPSILLLAWLRAMNNAGRGWAVILENAGYNIEEAREILDEEDYPEDMLEFKDELNGCNSIGEIAQKVFNRYGYRNAFTDKIIEVLQSTFNRSYMNRAEIIQFMEDNIESGETYEVDDSMKENVVKIQTIHAAKGLEYPIVFLSDVNMHRFPSTNNFSPAITYDDVVGIRARKIYSDDGPAFTYDNWRSEILFKCLDNGYDEERRLMYVAVTRAEQHLFITATEGKESQFFTGLDISEEYVTPDVEPLEDEDADVGRFVIDDTDYSSPRKIPVTSVVEPRGGNAERGRDMHRLSEDFINGREVNAENSKEEELLDYLSDLKKSYEEVMAEQDMILPIDGQETVLKGKADIVAVSDDKVRVIDIKTGDVSGEDYRKQLTVYRKVLESEFPEKTIGSYIYCVETGEEQVIQPVDLGDVVE